MTVQLLATHSPLHVATPPVLIDTGRGATVSYKGRLLYSKYSPSKAALKTVEELPVLPNTLILACSPCLCYGMKELLQKLPNECFIAAIESDKELYLIAKEHFPHDARCALLKKEDAARLFLSLSGYDDGAKSVPRLPEPWTLRRVIRLNLSGGVQLDSRFYGNVFDSSVDAVCRYWKNRATIIRFGRLYSRNVFRNIARLPSSVPLNDVLGTVSIPIVVFGAGESMAQGARQVLQKRNAFFVIAVDAAITALLKMGVVPDAIVTEEAQSVIANAFIGMAEIKEMAKINGSAAEQAAAGQTAAGMAGKKMLAFLSISGWSGAFDAVKESAQCNTVYYATQYFPSHFLKRLVSSQVLPPLLPPLGSVGITAARLALRMRSRDDVCVYLAGLDFSYSAGATHVKGSSACISRLSSSNRLLPCEAYEAAFGEGALKAEQCTKENADGKCTTEERQGTAGRRTMPNMALYAKLFKEQFSGTKNLYNSGYGGVPLGIPYRGIAEADASITNSNAFGIADVRYASCGNGPLVGDTISKSYSPTVEKDVLNDAKQSALSYNGEVAERVIAFYDGEKRALQELCKLLTGGGTLSKAEREKEVMNILRGREYLYLHFPDYKETCTDAHFLRRVKAEAALFLKDIGVGMRIVING